MLYKKKYENHDFICTDFNFMTKKGGGDFVDRSMGQAPCIYLTWRIQLLITVEEFNYTGGTQGILFYTSVVFDQEITSEWNRHK